MANHLFQLRSQIQALQPDLVEWRRQFHQQPELGFQEQITAFFISQMLQEWGIEHQTGIAQTGIVATIKGNKQAPEFNPKSAVLAIRADMDALPINEENNVSYRSVHRGIMHACGHDGHTAIVLGVAKYLSQHRDFIGTVKLIFQPAEEGLGGAKAMIEAGVLKDVDGILGLHIWNNMPLGTVGVRSGALMAASESFYCKILGKGGHAASPHQTVDAVIVTANIINNLQTIVARNVDPLESVVITIGELHAGTKRNIIPSTAEFSGTVRHFNPELSNFLQQRIEQVIAGVCQIYGANYELDYQCISPPVINDAAFAEMVHSAALSVIEISQSVVSNCQTMAGEDMALYLQKVPGCFFFLGSVNLQQGLHFPHHHPRFDFDETVLAMGVEIFVRCVEKFCR
jgi:amidohydrolase